ncbi:MAG: type VI-B CRISPR-associated RNA-guided ribonuclease Cas13b [Saprospiraceae bacterium]|nr:type VI-B CRISPR-associated RNA-guided ribonuclease Cas13b [Saprospiraceae bacterium]
MDTKNTQPEKKYYDFREESDKHYFAGLLNMAQHNFDKALQEVARRIHFDKKSKGKMLIENLFDTKILYSDIEYRKTILCEFLPFVEQIRSLPLDNFKSILKLFYETLDDFRNYYTHYYHKPVFVVDKDNKIGFFAKLDQMLAQAAKDIQEKRVEKVKGYREALPKKYEIEFDGGKYTDRIINTFSELYQLETKKVNENGKEENKEVPVIRKVAKTESEIEGKFTPSGFIFFLSLFLNKNTLTDLYAHTKYFKDVRRLEHQVKHWVYSKYAFRDVKKLLRSDYSNDALLLAMIDELTKCPKQLFDLLDAEHQAEFIEDTNEYARENSDGLDIVSHDVIRKRYENKFMYFAIRFLDEFAGFEKIKFQVNLGTYVHDVNREKKFESYQQKTERTLRDHIRIFGKLSEIEKKKKDYFVDKNKDNNEKEFWQEYPNAYYHITNDNIAFEYDDKEMKKIRNAALSTIKDVTKERTAPNKTGRKHKLVKTFNQTLSIGTPDAFLSINELPALLYQFIIKKESASVIEGNIFSKIKEQVEHIKNLHEPLNKQNTPKKLLKTTTEKYNFDKLYAHISKEKKYCTDKIKETNDYLDKSKYKTFGNKQRGEIATWLANDIKRFAPAAVRKNWKSYQHNELQTLLSFYTTRKADIRLLLEREIGLKIDDKMFILQEALKRNSLEDFYLVYLRKRKNKLEKWLEKVKDKQPDDDIFNVFSKKLYLTKNIADYQAALLNLPMNLPRGIFDTHNFTNKIIDDNGKEKLNMQPWFCAAQSSQLQKFYEYKRAYQLKTDKKKPLILDPTLTSFLEQEELLEKQDFKTIFNNEKELRKIARQDFYVLEMIKYMLKKLHGHELNISLHDIFLDREEKAEKQKLVAQQHQREKGDKSENIVLEDYILSKKIKVSILNNKVVDELPLKDVGKFRNLENDERVQLLVTYLPERIWNKLDVEKEIANYEMIRRKELFQEVHNFEKRILAKAKITYPNEEHPQELEKKDNPHFKYYVAYHFFEHDDKLRTFIREESKIEDDNISKEIKADNILKEIQNKNNPMLNKAVALIFIRNKIAHNQLIPKALFDLLQKDLPITKYVTTGETEYEKIGDYLLRVFNTYAQ